MTRETKVGLVIGLGVILLVGIIVSEYFVRDETLPDQPLAQGLADFNNTSNQSATHPRERVGLGGDAPAPGGRDPLGVMSATEQLTEPGPGELTRPGPAPGIRPGPGPVRPGANVALTPPPTQPTPGRIAGGAAVTPNPGTPGSAGQIAALPPITPTPQPILPIVNERDETIDYDVDNTQPPEPLEAQPPRVASVEHVVVEGETLSHIARRYYNGDGNMWRSIRDANLDHVSPEGLVRAGTVLTIPKRGADLDTTARGAAGEAEVIGQGLADRERVQATRGRLVTVKEGDTLSGIASEHLGSANDWRMILDANPDVLTDASQLRPGMRLRIPPQAETEVAELANTALETERDTSTPPDRRVEETRPTTPAAPTRTYTVVSGETLTAIAEKTLGNGNRFHEIYEANKDQLDSPDDIREGMVLRLPATASATN